MKDSIASLDAVARRLWRRLVRGALALPLVLPVLAGAAQAGYPDKPIRMVVPYPAGGAADVVARGGRVRALAVTGKTRLRSAPEIPTTEEAGLQGLEFYTWYGLWAPKGLPGPIAAALEAAAREIAANPKFVAAMDDKGLQAIGSSSAEFAALIATESRLYRSIAQRSNLRITSP
ncbi:Bug family tripartite tricarboxylate transporter substrate binding protein [Variovorax sp. Varisp41]|uniref:Bug family tripartite tricarboxylate transporter substrate binding protein n=1 Tax=Variovorax sp. Varisp41 TaxID=3243033 RepID=UPI0039B6751F